MMNHQQDQIRWVQVANHTETVGRRLRLSQPTALAMEIDKENISAALAAVNSIIKGECKEYSLGGGAWVIHIRPTVVEFESSDFDELNTGENNIFPVKEFKWVLAAWSEFLDIPDQAGGTKYEFTLPVREIKGVRLD